MEKVEKHLVSDFKSILLGKLYNFKKRSFWKYLIASFILALTRSGSSGSFLPTFLFIFFGILLIVMIAIIVSAKILAQKNSFDAIVEFNSDKIIITHQNKDLVEEKGWEWIKKMVIEKEIVFFEINQNPPLLISISRDYFSKEEIAFFDNPLLYPIIMR